MEKQIRRVVIAVNSSRKDAAAFAEEAGGYFRQLGSEVELIQVPLKKSGSFPIEADLAMSIGGDGTLLYCARLLAGRSIPILAVNMGDFGFIAEISRGEWREALNMYLDGRLEISPRMMFEAEVLRGTGTAARFWGLNDAVIQAKGIAKIIRLQLFLSNTYVGRYRADGVIVSTPTGSTAYSMAAGGPILHPEMTAFVLNPICPFTLSNRPMVLPSDESLEILVEEEQRVSIVLLIDGQDPFLLSPNDRVRFRKSDRQALIIRSDKRNFYEVLRAKLNWAGEPNA